MPLADGDSGILGPGCSELSTSAVSLAMWEKGGAEKASFSVNPSHSGSPSPTLPFYSQGHRG